MDWFVTSGLGDCCVDMLRDLGGVTVDLGNGVLICGRRRVTGFGNLMIVYASFFGV